MSNIISQNLILILLASCISIFCLGCDKRRTEPNESYNDTRQGVLDSGWVITAFHVGIQDKPMPGIIFLGLSEGTIKCRCNAEDYEYIMDLGQVNMGQIETLLNYHFRNDYDENDLHAFGTYQFCVRKSGKILNEMRLAPKDSANMFVKIRHVLQDYKEVYEVISILLRRLEAINDNGEL